MKNIYILSCFIFLLVSKGYSCDPITFSFCVSSEDFSQEKIFSGKIFNQDANSVELEIIEVLRGEESSSTVTIWNGTDIYCNGPFFMWTSHYGDINDTVICVVQEISSVENSWDVVGDYRRPSSINHITFLTVENGSIENWGENYSYSEFINNEVDDCISTYSNEYLLDELNVYPNPTSNSLVIDEGNYNGKTYSIIAINGQIIHPLTSLPNSNTINVNELYSGVYLLKVIDADGIQSITRFIKT